MIMFIFHYPATYFYFFFYFFYECVGFRLVLILQTGSILFHNDNEIIENIPMQTICICIDLWQIRQNESIHTHNHKKWINTTKNQIHFIAIQGHIHHPVLLFLQCNFLCSLAMINLVCGLGGSSVWWRGSGVEVMPNGTQLPNKVCCTLSTAAEWGRYWLL